MDITIRPAQPEDFPALRAIELAAFETLRAAGAVKGPAYAGSLEDFSRYSRDGLLLTATRPDGTPTSFAAALFMDNWLHIAKIDVHPDWQGQGIGRQLMKTLLAAGREQQLFGATLTTDSIATFNARFYASLGFETPVQQAHPPHLMKLLESEIDAGFDALRRVAMVLSF